MTLLIETEVPNWVKWVAQDEDGCWNAYEEEPSAEDGDWSPGWVFSQVGKWMQIGDSGKSNSKWRDTLRKIEDIRVSLIIETEIPNWVKWVAQEENGDWYAYEKKPSAECHSWGQDQGVSGKWIQIGGSEKPNPKWRDTLHKIVVKP